MAVSGDTIEITYNHPELGTGTFSPKAAEASTVDMGGRRSTDEAAGITANGQVLRQITTVRWSYEVVCANDMHTNEDVIKARQLAAHPVEATWTFTNINGIVYTGTGAPVGDLQGDDYAGTFTLKVSGGGELRKIT